MPRFMYSPTKSSPKKTLQETQSEPDITNVVATCASEYKTCDSANITKRPGKRFRGDDIYSETDKFEQLQNMLETWKAEQNITLNKLITEVSELKQQNTAIQNTNLEIEKSITFINKGYEDMKNRVETLEKEQKDIRERLRVVSNGNYSETVAILETKIDLLEQQARLCNIEICNVPEKRNENLLTIMESIGKAVHMPVSLNDIISIHRVPHAQQRDSKPKNVIVKVKSRALRDNLISAYRKVKSVKSDQIGIAGASVPIYINEHLTFRNKTLFRKAREAARKRSYKYVWIKNATILVSEGDGSPAFAIRSDADLNKFFGKGTTEISGEAHIPT